MKFTVCQHCKKALQAHERPEGFCDACCRAHTPPPSLNREPTTIRGGELERIEVQDWRRELP